MCGVFVMLWIELLDEVFFKVCLFVIIYVDIVEDVDFIVNGDRILILCVDCLILFFFLRLFFVFDFFLFYICVFFVFNL